MMGQHRSMKRFEIITEADARALEPGTSVELAPRRACHAAGAGHAARPPRHRRAPRRPRSRRSTRRRRHPQHRRRQRSHRRGAAARRWSSGCAGGARRCARVARRQRTRRLSGYRSGGGPGGCARRGRRRALPSTGPASARPSPPTRCGACGRPCACTPTLARYAREHNGANVLTLGATLLSVDEAWTIVETWLATAMTEPRYIRRLAKIRALESSATRTTR